jgi:hypothetical protein
VPSATVLPDQLEVVLHVPPAVFVHVPLVWAGAVAAEPATATMQTHASTRRASAGHRDAQNARLMETTPSDLVTRQSMLIQTTRFLNTC